MSQDENLYTIVTTWIETVTGIKTIRYHEEGPTPVLPGMAWIAVNFISRISLRHHEQKISYIDADTGDMDTGDVYPDTTAAPLIEREWQYSVHAFEGRNVAASDVIGRIEAAAKLTQIMEPLTVDYIVHRVGAIQHIPVRVDNRWEKRAIMDLFVRGMSDDGFEIDMIERITAPQIERL